MTTTEQRQIGKVLELACLSSDTLVLTQNGYKPLISVTSDDCLWDGEEWVKHEGLVYRGRKQTVELDGVRMTPDHLVLSPTGWKQASHFVSNKSTLRQSLDLASGSLPLSKSWKRHNPVSAEFLFSAPAALCRIPFQLATSLTGKVHDAICVLRRKLMHTAKNIFVMPMHYPTTKYAEDYLTASPPQLIAVTNPVIDYSTIMGDVGSWSASNGSKINERFSCTFVRLRA